jgi:hypothetical protein
MSHAARTQIGLGQVARVPQASQSLMPYVPGILAAGLRDSPKRLRARATASRKDGLLLSWLIGGRHARDEAGSTRYGRQDCYTCRPRETHRNTCISTYFYTLRNGVYSDARLQL